MAINCKKVIFAFLCAALCVWLATIALGCSSKTTESTEDENVITLQQSQAGAEKYKQLKARHSKTKWQKQNYSELLKSLENIDSQSFPVMITGASQSHKTYKDGLVYKLGRKGAKANILFIHGGAYIYGISEDHISLCDKLSNRLNADVYMPLYKLAPENTYESAYALLDEFYEELRAQDKPLYIMGDSAGGGLTLAYVEYLKENNKELPDKAVLISPWLDVTMSNSKIDKAEKLDPTLSKYSLIQAGKLWAGNTGTKDYKISPIYGNVSELCETMLVVGTKEIMYPDVKKLYKKMIKAGDSVTLVVGSGMWHDFAFYDVPEATECLNEIVSFCKE